MKTLSWKRRLLEGLRYGLPLPRRRRLPAPVILMYHGVIARCQDPILDRWALSAVEFARHLDYLERHYRIVSLNRLMEAIHAGEHPADWIVLTFDDGFANLYTQARPLLRARGLPYAVAISAGLLGTERTIWSLELRLSLLRTRIESIRLFRNNRFELFSLQGRSQRQQIADRMGKELLALNDEERQRRLDSLLDALPSGEFERLMRDYGELRLMSIEQIRQMHAEGVTIMGHGFSHAYLGDDESPDVLDREICLSREKLSDLLNASVDCYVYPFGRDTESARRVVRASGYKAALGVQPGFVGANADLLSLPRVHAECSLNHLRHQLARLANGGGS